MEFQPVGRVPFLVGDSLKPDQGNGAGRNVASVSEHPSDPPGPVKEQEGAVCPPEAARVYRLQSSPDAFELGQRISGQRALVCVSDGLL